MIYWTFTWNIWTWILTSVKCNSLGFDFIFNFFYLCIGFVWNNDANNQIQWAMDCDLPGQDSSQIRMPNSGANCGSACARDPVCTHFTWSSINGGTCFMKSGFRNGNTSIFVRGAVCGIWVGWSSGVHEEVGHMRSHNFKKTFQILKKY